MPKEQRVKPGRAQTRPERSAALSPKAEARRQGPSRRRKQRPRTPGPSKAAANRCRTSSRRSSARCVDEAAVGREKWLHEIKFDGYRMQLRIEGGKPSVAHAHTGLTGPLDFSRDREGGPWACPTPSSTARSSRSMPPALPELLRRMQAALAAGKDRRSGLFRLRPAVRSTAPISARLALGARKAATRGDAGGKRRAADADDPLRRAFHHRRSAPCSDSARKIWGSRAIVSKKARPRSIAPGVRTAGPRRNAGPAHEVVLGGWTDNDGKFRSLARRRVPRRPRSPTSGASAPASAPSTIERLMPKLKAHARKRKARSTARSRAPPRDQERAHWLEPVLVAEIEFAGWSTDGVGAPGLLQGTARGQARRRSRWPRCTAARRHGRSRRAEGRRRCGSRERTRKGRRHQECSPRRARRRRARAARWP